MKAAILGFAVLLSVAHLVAVGAGSLSAGDGSQLTCHGHDGNCSPTEDTAFLQHATSGALFPGHHRPGPLHWATTVPPSPPLTFELPPFGPVAFPQGSDFRTLVQRLEAVPNVTGVTPLLPGEQDYDQGFFPTPPTVPDFDNRTAFGDRGYREPGFGGINTYNVVRIRSNGGLKLYRMTFERNPSSRMCGNFWSTADTYNTSLVEASINVATCSDYTKFIECTMKEVFVTLLGQGGDLSLKASISSRRCNGTVQRQLAHMNAYPLGPSPDVLQVLLPACSRATSCRACDLNRMNVLDSLKGECSPITIPEAPLPGPPQSPAEAHR